MWSLFKVSLRYLEDTILIKIQERHQWQLHTLLWYFYYWLWTSKWRPRTLSHFFCIYHNKSFLTLVVIFQKNLFTSECIIAGKIPKYRVFFWSVSSCIRREYRDLLRKSLSSVQIRENKDQKKLGNWTPFAQCNPSTTLLQGSIYVKVFLIECHKYSKIDIGKLIYFNFRFWSCHI